MQYFTTFSPEHLIAIAVIFLTAGACVGIARNQRFVHLVKPVSWTLAIIAVGHELLFIGGVFALGQWPAVVSATNLYVALSGACG